MTVASGLAAAGFTHGGFYKHFGSKADLTAESMACGIAQTTALSEGMDASKFVRDYLTREHRDDRATGCAMAALGGDAARQPESVRVAFEDGVQHLVAALSPQNGAPDAAGAAQARARILDVLAHAMGALVMSRACPDDSPLADEILAVNRDAILESLRSQQATRATSAKHWLSCRTLRIHAKHPPGWLQPDRHVTSTTWRSSSRKTYDPDYRGISIGFRLALWLEP